MANTKQHERIRTNEKAVDDHSFHLILCLLEVHAGRRARIRLDDALRLVAVVERADALTQLLGHVAKEIGAGRWRGLAVLELGRHRRRLLDARRVGERRVLIALCEPRRACLAPCVAPTSGYPKIGFWPNYRSETGNGQSAPRDTPNSLAPLAPPADRRTTRPTRRRVSR